MSIYQVVCSENEAINSRYIQSIDLTIQNLGHEEFDMLIKGLNSHGTAFIYLYHLNKSSDPNSVITIPDIYTNYEPFTLQLVTNRDTRSTAAITMYVKSNGNLVALFTQEDFSKIP
ncbi:hypothetical protein [Paenibacillus sp. SI8]|uniref:hypothetical protein n=1 Tax=unclassified Paenibacillus TaxID=185978 RepID=UPI00346697A5